MLKELRKLAYLSLALAAVSYGSHTANAASVITITSAGNCTGADVSGGAGADCVTAVGHISASVVDTLSINEKHAMSFGNMAVKCAGAACAGDSKLVLTTAGVVTATNATDTIFPLHGANANGGVGVGTGEQGNANSTGAAVAHFSVTGANEGLAGDTSQVYISFATHDTGSPINFDTETFNPAVNVVTLTGPDGTSTFTVDSFTIDCVGAAVDAYGHYCDSATMPLDVKVGATLHTATTVAAGGKYPPGKYVGTYDVTVSY